MNLVQGFFPGLGWLESNSLTCLDLDGFTSLWVTAHARSALPFVPGAEACNGNGSIFLDTVLNAVEDGVYNLF